MKEEIRLVRHPGPAGEDKVCLLVNGTLVADLPYQVAIKLGAEMVGIGKSISNEIASPRQVMDQAILMRAGFRLGLTKNVSVLKQAFNDAQWDRNLRRYMPSAPGIKSCEAVGIPSISVGEKPHV